MIKDFYYKSYWRIWYDTKCKNEISYYFSEGETDFSIMFLKTCGKKNKKYDNYCGLKNKNV